MRTRSLQLANLMIWSMGLLGLLALGVTAMLQGRDAFMTNEQVRQALGSVPCAEPAIARVEQQCFPQPAASQRQATVVACVVNAIPDSCNGQKVNEHYVASIVRLAQARKPAENVGAITRVYAPWVLIMITGLLAAGRGGHSLPASKAWVCLGASGVLQLLFVCFLAIQLYGQTDFGASIALDNFATGASAVVGALNQFIYRGNGS